MKRLLPISLLGAFCVLAPVAPFVFTACEPEPVKIVINMKSDLSTIIEAITDANNALTRKLTMIESAISDGVADSDARQEMILKALESLSGTMAEKFEAIDTAVKSQTTSLETKLALIEAAVAKGFADEKAQQKLIQQAIESLDGEIGEKLDAIETAIKGQTTNLETKLGLIEAAVTSGLADANAGQKLILQAIESLEGTMEEKLDAIDTAIQDQSISLEGKLDLINGELNSGLADAKTALDEIKTTILGIKDSLDDDGLITKIEGIVSKLGDIDTTINDNVSKSISDILGAIKGLKDYGEILTAIQQALEDLIPKPPVITISDEYMVENDEVMMLTEQSLPIAYTVTSESDVVVTVTTSDDISATVVPDTNNPMQGVIQIVSGKSITDGKTKVEVTASNKDGSVKRTLSIKEAYLKPLEPITQITETIHVAFDCTTLELKFKSNIETSKPELPDSLRWGDAPWLEVLSYDKTDETTTIQVKLQPNLGLSYRTTSVTVKDTRFHEAALKFRIQQGYDDKIIDFEDRDLLDKIRETVDIDNDFKICNAEAKMVKSLNDLFGDELTQGASYEFFNEFQYFTGIETIPAGSFKGWENLQSITLPESITTIQGGYGDEDGPFVECSSLKTISGKFATDDGKALNYNGILLKVLEEIAAYSIPDGVQVVGSKAFCKSMITNVYFPTSLKTIRDHAFEYSKIYAINFPTDPDNGTAYVDSIAENSFVHCLYLQKFEGPTANGKNRVTPDNLGLYQGTTLLAFAWGSTLKSNESPITAWSIPEGIQKLPESVFDAKGANSGSYLLRKLGLPSTLTYICKGAFQYLQNVSDANNKFSIYFKGGDPPTTVEKDAFMNVTPKTICLYVPAVLNSDNSVNQDATEERKKAFLEAMGMGDDFFSIESYTNWPFGF